MPLRPVPATSSRAQPLTRVDRLERLSADLDALIYAERLADFWSQVTARIGA